MDTIFNPQFLLYWAAIIVTVFATTLTLGKWWKRNENARWVIGWFLPFFFAFFMAWAGYFHAATVIALFIAVGFCGAIKVGVELTWNSRESERLRREDKTNANPPR